VGGEISDAGSGRYGTPHFYNPTGETMADWYPGAVRVDVGGNGNRITARPPENIFHIAASSWNVNVDNPTDLTGISGWIAEGSTEAHTYNDQYGFMLQYCSLFDAVDGTKDGNWRNRTHEAWNPPTGDLNISGYTAEQCERFSDFLAWDHNVNGVILRNMQDSRSSSHGCGVHRYGITAYNPYRQVGGEVWSTSTTKLCPGTARVAQLDGIIRRAQFLVDHNIGTLPPGRVDLQSALSRGGQKPPVEKDWFDMATAADLDAAIAKAIPSIAKAVWEFNLQSENADGGDYTAGTFLTQVDKHTHDIPKDVVEEVVGFYSVGTLLVDTNQRVGGNPTVDPNAPKA